MLERSVEKIRNTTVDTNDNNTTITNTTNEIHNDTTGKEVQEAVMKLFE